MSYSVLIADDHKLIRQTWSEIISANPHYSGVTQCSNGKEAVELALMYTPDVILMDINMPDINGIEATQLILKQTPLSKVIGVSSHMHPSYARKIFKEGAMGYVTKTSSIKELFTAMHDVLQNKRYLCEETKNLITEQAFNDDKQGGMHSLTKRETEIILLLKQGYSSIEIANQVNLSSKTVEVHRYNILKKLNLKNTAALINYVNNHVIG